MGSPATILSTAAASRPAKPALVFGETVLSYAAARGPNPPGRGRPEGARDRPGDRVSIYAQNRWEWIVAYHGILRAGGVVNPINVMLTPEEVAFVLNDCGAGAIVTSADRAPVLLELTADVPSLRHVFSFDEPPSGALAFGELMASDASPPDITMEPGALCTIGYTSGTTAHPKGAMQSHLAVFLNCALTATMHVRTHEDVMVTALPAPHVYGNVAINSIFMAGGTVVLMERFDPATALALVEEHGATLLEGVPTMYAMMLAHPDMETVDLSSLTRATVGGQTIATSTVEEWEQRSGAPLIELWGMTEIAGLGTTHALYGPNVHGSIGVGLPGIDVRVGGLDDPAATMPPGEPGELMVRGPIVMLGYFGNEQATTEAIEPDGWLHTGDVAVADEDGHFFIVDRRKDMLITAGYNVYPAEIERVVAAHPAVAMVAVGSRADELKGELARAYVVLRPGATATERELIDHCRPHLAAYKLPRSVAFVPDLPKTSTGKIMRRELHTLD